RRASLLRRGVDGLQADGRDDRSGRCPRASSPRTRPALRCALVEAEAAVTRGFIGLSAVVGLALLAIGVRALLVADAGPLVPPAALVPAFLFGVWIPLAVLLYAIRRQRVAVVALAFCLGLTVNVAYLANAVPADAAASSSSTFYWTLGSGLG